MAVAVNKPAQNPQAALSGTNPAVARVDDVRALKRRLRRLNFSGNYATGGETVTAQQCSLSRIVGVNILNNLTVATGGAVTGTIPSIEIATDRKSFVVRQLEDAAGAAGAPVGVEKNNAEAYIANSFLDIEVIGF